MTTYQANGIRFGGYALWNLIRTPTGNLVGSSDRLISTRVVPRTAQPFDRNQPDPISYFIDLQQTNILFSGQYGPYDLTCRGNKFAIVDSGDSLENFVFETKGCE